MEKYGYVRVSTRGQNEARQLAALEGYQILPRNLFTDKQSGKDFDRPAWRRLSMPYTTFRRCCGMQG